MALDTARAQQINVRGATLAVTRRGEGRPFYWGHGLTSSSEQETRAGLRPWSKLEQGWEVIQVDARGHGESSGSPEPDVYRWPCLAADLLALADALGHERFAIGGASMGAATALHAAVMAPERVEALVLVIPPTAWETRAEQAESYREEAALAEREGIEALIEKEAASPPIPIFAGLFEPGQLARARLEALDASRLPAILRGAAASDFPAPEEVSELRVPTLILAWEGDDGHPLSSAEQLNALLPDARLSVARRLRDLGAWPGLVAELCAGL